LLDTFGSLLNVLGASSRDMQRKGSVVQAEQARSMSASARSNPARRMQQQQQQQLQEQQSQPRVRARAQMEAEAEEEDDEVKEAAFASPSHAGRNLISER